MSDDERKVAWERKKVNAMLEYVRAVSEQDNQPVVLAEEKQKNVLKTLKLPDHKDVRVFIAGMFFTVGIVLSGMVFTTSDMPLRTATWALVSIVMSCYLWYTRDNERSDLLPNEPDSLTINNPL